MKGRPRKDLNSQKLICHKVYFNYDEYTRFLTLAEESNLKKSDFSRKCLLYPNEISVGKDLIRFIFELNKVGVNLNQFIKKLNSLKNDYPVQVENFLNKTNPNEVVEATQQLQISLTVLDSIIKSNFNRQYL
jgi:hypothetical protein